MEELRKRQKDEIRVLKSIYAEHFTNLNENGVLANFKFKITLYPTKSESQYGSAAKFYVQIDLVVEYPDDYPNGAPILRLENEKGLSIELVRSLNTQLAHKVEAEKGREIIHDLCVDIQEFLYTHNKPPAKSFFEQRLENKAAAECEDNLLMINSDFKLVARKAAEDSLLNLEIENAVDEKKKLLQEERKKEKRERLLSNSEWQKQQSNEEIRDNNESKINENIYLKEIEESTYSPKSAAAAKKPQANFQPFTIEFTDPQTLSVQCIRLVDYVPENSLYVYRGLGVSSNEMFDVYEWRICLEKNNVFEKKKLDMCTSKINKIIEEFKNLSKASSANKFLVKYISYKYFKDTNKNFFIVQLCTEYVDGHTIDFFINNNVKRPSFIILDSTLRLYIFQLLSALDALHSNHIIHRDLNSSCVHVERNGIRLRLGRYSLFKKLNNLNDLVANEAANEITGSVKSDIHQLGLLILSLATGRKVNEYHHPQIPTDLQPNLKNFISICVKDMDKIDCKYLQNHDYLTKRGEKEEDEWNQVRLVQAKRTISNNYNDDDDVDLRKFTDYPVQSRLNIEFEVLGQLGRGAFGEVLKVRNKLDWRLYAIKRIRINPNNKQINKQITREIKLLSRLNHENVVRYYSTWIEQYEQEVKPTSEVRRKSQSTSLGETPPSTTTSAHTTTTGTTGTKSMIKFKSVNDESSSSSDNDGDGNSISSSSSESNNAGLVRWNRTTKTEDDKDLSFSTNSFEFVDQEERGAGSSSSSSSMSSAAASASSSSSSSSSDDDEKEESLPVTAQQRRRPFHSSDENPKPNKNKNASPTKKKPAVASSSSDESVIFADESDKPDVAATTKKSAQSPAQQQTPPSNTTAAKRDTKPTGSKQIQFKSRAKSQEISPKKVEKPRIIRRQYIYIQMEYCGGKTLKDLIEKGLYQNEDKVWCLFREILQGLNHIHEQGMIHRDLKPGNVLIDATGHAKIGDFGLATTRLMTTTGGDATTATTDTTTAAAAAAATTQTTDDMYSPHHHHQHQQQHGQPLMHSSHLMSSQLDSVASLSGAVGTALYVAPELMTPNKNRFIYTQKVDIYSLGIMFYEMWFAFPTNMERIYVIQNLRQKDIIISEAVDKEQYKRQIALIRQMLNHDPNQRPSAKDLLLNDSIPRKADEIALDQLLKYSFDHKQSTSYKKIIKSVFDQTVSKIDDASFDSINCKLQESVFNMLVRIFQKHGGYMMSYPLLTPCGDVLLEYPRAFKVADSSGLVLCLPYNHRYPFARYLARTGITDIKRYYIGKVYSEKLKITSLHPREHMEASFDIISSTLNDGVPEIELLTMVIDVINSTSELIEQNYLLVVNHSYLLYSIMNYCGINESLHKNIFYILSEYNNKLIRSINANKETRTIWLKEQFSKLKMTSNEIEKFLNYLMKYGESEKVLSDLRNLTKSESQFSKLAKEAISQMKAIVNNLAILDSKIPIQLAASFVLPVVSNPLEYSGFMFQLLVRSKNNKNEYNILASGGRYDNMITQFKNKNLSAQFAVGVSFDFEKIVSLIHDKSRQNVFRAELAVCSIGNESLASPPGNSNNQQSTTTGSMSALGSSPPYLKGAPNKNVVRKRNAVDSNAAAHINTNLMIQYEMKNRLQLYKHFSMINKNFNICTHLIHAKFSSVEEMDEYCKKHSINNYTFINDTSVAYTAQLFASHSNLSGGGGGSTDGGTANTGGSSSSSSNAVTFTLQQPLSQSIGGINSISSSSGGTSYVKIRSCLVDKGYRFVEKKFNLNDFLHNASALYAVMTSSNANSPNYLQNTSLLSSPFTAMFGASSNSQTNTMAALSSSFGSSLSLSSNTSSSQAGSSQASNTSYFDFLNSLFISLNTSNVYSHHHHISSNASSTSLTITSSSLSGGGGVGGGSSSGAGGSSISSSTSSSTSTSTLNYLSQANFHMLVDSGWSSSSGGRSSTGGGGGGGGGSGGGSSERGSGNAASQALKAQIVAKCSGAFALFAARTRIEIIVVDLPDIVINTLATCLRLDAGDEQCFQSSWNQCLEQISNLKHKRLLCNYNLDQVIRDLRYVRRSKVFILYNLKSEQFKLLVAL